MDYLTSKQILFTGIIAVLISGLVGMFGMMGMYSVFPNAIGFDKPVCDFQLLPKDTECGIANSYEQTRQIFTVLGWFFGFIPIVIWRLFVSWNLNQKLESSEKCKYE